MIYLIPSQITLTETGLCFKTADKYEEINYKTIIWIYIRKKRKQGMYSLYRIEQIGTDICGELVVIDENKNVYLFLEEALERPAGQLLIEMMRYYDACYVGYNRLFRKLYQTNFEEMRRTCHILQEIR